VTDDELALQETAEAAEEARNYVAAFDAWQRLASRTSRPDYLCKAGRAAAKLGRWADAERAFLDALKADNQFPLGKLARMPHKLGSSTDAETLLDALKDGKPFPLAMVFLGSLFLARTDRNPSANARTAKAWLEKAFAAAPGPMSLSLLGSAHVRLGEKEDAKEAFRKAIELDESYAEAYFNFGLLLADDGKNEEAEVFLRKATQLDPEFGEAHGRLGIVLQELGKYSEAEEELRRAIEIDPADTIASFHLNRSSGGEIQ
jgi:tetratricopeptide (TPR) repeat protein